MNTKDTVVQLALIGGAMFVLYKLLSKGIDTATDALNNVGSAIGSGLFDFFHPNAVGEMTFYSVTFPPAPIGDGKRHSVPSRSVNSHGQFTLGAEFAPNFAVPHWMQRRWQIVKDKTGAKFATPA